MKDERTCDAMRQLAAMPSKDLSLSQYEQLQAHLAVCTDCNNMQKNYDELRTYIHNVAAKERGPDITPQWPQILKNIQARREQLTWAAEQRQLAHKSLNLGVEDREKNLVMATAYFQNALHVYTSEDYPVQRVEILYDLGCTYRDLSDLPEKDRLTNLEVAVTHFKEAQDIAREHQLVDNWIIKLDQAISECYQQRLQFLKHRADVAKAIADVLRLTNQRDSALDNYDQALRLYRLVESRLDEAIVLKDMGDVHCSLQNMDAAMQHYQQALACFEQMNHRHDVATVLQAMGDVAQSRHEEAQARQFYVKALDLFRQVKDDFSEASVLASMGTEVKEVALFQKVGEANIPHMEARSNQGLTAVLDQPIHNETIVRSPDEATRSTPPLADAPEMPERDSPVTHTGTVIVTQRAAQSTHATQTGSKWERWAALVLLILAILIASSEVLNPWQKIASTLPQATPTPAIGPNPIKLTVNTNSDRLLAGDSTTVTNIEQQINTQLQRQNISQLTANVVKTSGGGTDLSHDQQVAHQTNSILRTMNEQNIVFNSQTVFEDHIDLNKPDGIITIEIYAFAAPTDLITAGTLTVGSDTTYPPQEFIDTTTGQATGFDIDLITAMAHRMGLNVEVKNANFTTIIDDLNAKHYDLVISAQAITDDRKKQVDFVPYFNSGMSLLVQKGNPQHIQLLKDLCGQTAGVEDGTTELDQLNATNKICEQTGKSDIKMTILKNQTDVIQLLVHHLVTAIFQDSPVTDYYNKTSYPGQFEVAGPVIKVGPEGISIRKGDTSMFNAVQQAFNAVKADGTYDKLFEKWKLDTAQKI